jgi:hypothetical protein
VCIPAPAAAVPGKTTGEVVPSDLWAWRKYGQKPIKGSPYPRYVLLYGCTSLCIYIHGTYCCMAAPLSSSFLLHVYMHQVISMPVIIMVTITLIHCSNLENAQAQHIPLLNQERETLHIDISPFSNIVQKHDKLLCNWHVGKVVLYYYYVFFFLGVVLLLWPSNLISAINCIYV